MSTIRWLCIAAMIGAGGGLVRAEAASPAGGNCGWGWPQLVRSSRPCGCCCCPDDYCAKPLPCIPWRRGAASMTIAASRCRAYGPAPAAASTITAASRFPCSASGRASLGTPVAAGRNAPRRLAQARRHANAPRPVQAPAGPARRPVKAGRRRSERTASNSRRLVAELLPIEHLEGILLRADGLLVHELRLHRFPPAVVSRVEIASRCPDALPPRRAARRDRP